MIGETISHFRILEKLGEGGMGEVFLAQDTSLDRKVALKFLPDLLQQDPTARKRFLREAKSAAALDHPFICSINEVGEEAGKSFISMEYVQGGTLKERLARGRFALREGLQALGLTYWLTRSPEPAREPVRQPILTRLTSDSGLSYQPALTADGKLLAFASDRAGEGNLDIWVKQIPDGEPIRVTHDEADDHEPDFSPDGTKIVFRSNRGGGGIYVMPALGGDARLVAREGRRPRFSPDGKRIAYWVGEEHYSTGRIFVVPSAGGEPRQVHRGRSPVWSPDGKYLLFVERIGGLFARTSELPEPDWWVAPADGGDAIKTGALEALRRQGLSEVPERTQILPEVWGAGANSLVFAARLGDTTNLWRIGISLGAWQAVGPAERLTSGTGIESSAALAASGRLVFESLNHNIDIWSLPLDANEGKVAGGIRQVTTDAAADRSPSLSAEGKRLVFASDRRGNWDIWMKDLESGKETALTASPRDEQWPGMRPDGGKAAFCVRQEDGRVSIYVVSPPEGLAEEMCGDCGVITDWSSDGKNILYYPPGGEGIYVLNIMSREAAHLLGADQGGVFNARFSPDGRWIAFHETTQAVASRIFITPFRDGAAGDRREWIAITDGSTSDQRAARSPDGNLLYFLSRRDGFRCIWAQRLDPAAKQPVGVPFEVYHSPGARRPLGNLLSDYYVGLSVARDKIAFTMVEITGNIWMTGPLYHDDGNPSRER